ncbi:MAG: hypothetical protein WBD46_00510 [Acidobacteriaceae bacterium]
MRTIAEGVELADGLREVNVLPEEYARLLGYPRGWTLEGRPLELAEWARDWYAEHGRPWIYARQAQSFSLAGGGVSIDGARFTSPRLEKTLRQAEAHSVILAAISAGAEAEEEARRRWENERPDEYFFLEIYGSAVVEHLTALAGARLCDWAEQNGMAVLPHFSPGYPEWDVAEQPQLLALLEQTRRTSLPGPLEALESGMLRPKKTQLAVFGLTRHTDRVQRLTELNPCESCTFGPCRYRRAPYRRAPRSCGEPVPAMAVLDRDAEYSVNRRALARWAAQRLTLTACDDGSLNAVFRYDGTTCTNMGRPLAFDYRVKLGPRSEGYPIREQHCAPAAGDTGHTFMCQYVGNPEGLMAAIAGEKPLLGEKLNTVLAWRREASGAGCFCTSPSRDHKWGLVFETIHYALLQQEPALNGNEEG